MLNTLNFIFAYNNYNNNLRTTIASILLTKMYQFSTKMLIIRIKQTKDRRKLILVYQAKNKTVINYIAKNPTIS